MVLSKITCGLVQSPKSAIFLFSPWGWMAGWILIFADDFFHTVQPIEIKLKTHDYFNKQSEALISFWYIPADKH